MSALADTPAPDDVALDAEVIVVGGGPVGATAALKLAQGGMSVIVLEQREATSLEERATTFHSPTLEMLDDLGLAQRLIERGIVADSFQFRDAKLGKIVDLQFEILANDTRFPFRLQCEQSVMTSMAIEALDADPHAEYHPGSRVGTITRRDDAVEIEVLTGPRTGRLRARHVIGADGMRSTVREQAGIGFTGRTYPERFLVISTGEPLDELFPDIAYVNYVADPVDWHVLMRNPSGWRILFPAPPDRGTDAEVLAPDNVLAQFRRVLPDHGPESIMWATLYQVHRMVADRLRDGPLYLIGDAAHVNNPMGGMGMNSGVHDGQLLAEILLRGHHGEEIDAELDEWADRRRAVALDFVGKETEENWSALRDDDEQRRAQQRAAWEGLAHDADARLAFLLNASMISSLRG
jgi:3-(3-hydroxy-phenyl)propionate hydroxylase